MAKHTREIKPNLIHIQWLKCAWNAFIIWQKASLTVQGRWGQMKPWCHTCFRLLLGGKDSTEVSVKEGCSLLCIRGELSTVHNYQNQICLLYSGEEKEDSSYNLELIFILTSFIFIYPSSFKALNSPTRDQITFCYHYLVCHMDDIPKGHSEVGTVKY